MDRQPTRFRKVFGLSEALRLRRGARTLRERWIDVIYRAAIGARYTRLLLTPLGALLFGVFSTLFVLAAVAVDSLLGLPGLLPEAARLPVSVPIFSLGVFIIAWSASHFLHVKGTPVPFNPPPAVVSTGPYAYVRNPMLVGVFLVLFGLGFALNSLSLLLVFTPLYVWVNVWEVKHVEEPELVRRLGDDYVDYRRKTPMFLPSPRPGQERGSRS